MALLAQPKQVAYLISSRTKSKVYSDREKWDVPRVKKASAAKIECLRCAKNFMCISC